MNQGPGDGPAQHVEAQAGAHRALDRRHADLAVALRGVRVADREVRTGQVHRDVERRAGREVPRVDVAAALVRRERDERALAVGAGAHGAAERHDRDLDAGHERRRRAAAQVERAHEAVGELVGQQAELGQDRAPAPVARLEREDLDRERVARARALHADGPREVVERVEVELRTARTSRPRAPGDRRP